jgi:predicted nucleic acid-binding protein
MKFVFVDTAALIAIGDKRDRFHYQALMIRDNLRRSKINFVTTDAVLLELAGYFSQSKNRQIAVSLTDAISKSDKWKRIALDDSLMKRGFDHYRKMSDKDWSLADCIGIIIAEDYGITDIFTSDHHFEQAGFTILLKE